jgi:diguanylate cyclase (GGDEF)-like protein
MSPGARDQALSRVITALAAIIALTFAVGVPAASFTFARANMAASMQAEAKIGAMTLSQLASQNPEMWRFEDVRIRGLLTLLGDASAPEWRRVLDVRGNLVAEQRPDLAEPLMTVAAPLYDSGAIVGRVEVVRSQRSLVIHTVLLAFPTATLGTLAFVLLRLLPLRLLRHALARASHLATHDPLTDLPNRALFYDRLDRALAGARRDGGSLAVLCLDLDRFKEVNDTLGHAAGDQLLAAVATRLVGRLRETDTLARIGGDEFAIVQVGVRDIGDVERLAGRLVDAIVQPFDLAGHQACVGISIGMTLRTGADLILSQASRSAVVHEADVALYRAKMDGRGVYRFFKADMNRELVERRQLEADLREGLKNGQFHLHYQPQIGLETGQIVGAEALLRWTHPRRGAVSPEAFIPLAEEIGLIVPLGEWVLNEACRQAMAWPGLRCMAVNVSPVQFRRADFVGQVERALGRSGLSPERLELEITEGMLLMETQETLATLRLLRTLGVTIAMDDFGTGYSSLGYLQKFRFDKIKIDRSFVCRLGADASATEIVRAVLRTSHAMGMRVNAEGIETEQQAAMLRSEGCEEVQGFLFGKPMPAEAFAGLLVGGGSVADIVPDAPHGIDPAEEAFDGRRPFLSRNRSLSGSAILRAG